MCVINFLVADSRARLVAGSFQGKTGHVDGKPSDARFNHPKGVAMDDKGNVYIADIDNLAVRKVGEGGMYNDNDTRITTSFLLHFIGNNSYGLSCSNSF